MSFTVYRRRTFSQHIRWAGLSVCSGILAGLVVSFFLGALEAATQARLREARWLWALPAAGLLIGWVFQRFGGTASRGTNLVLDEIHDPQKVLPRRLVPLVFAGSVLTHLAGASTGREGAAVQMGASLADQLSRFFAVDAEERRILLVCGAGAGFAAGIGTPLAGMIFGMEAIQIGRLRLFGWLEALLAACAAEWTTHLLRASHMELPLVEIGAGDFRFLGAVALFGLLCGLAARLFAGSVHLVERAHAAWFTQPMFRPLAGGIVLAALFWFGPGLARFSGLGLAEIQAAFRRPAALLDPVWKSGLTALSVGSGFKGGEFIPLVFLGTTLGSALAGLFSLPLPLFAALGFAAVFAGASNTPVACTVMAMEIFGWKIFPFAAVACFLSYYASGHAGIYRAQRLAASKHERVAALWRLLGELPRRFRR